MTFGRIAKSEGEILKTLRRSRQSIRAKLERMDGKVLDSTRPRQANLRRAVSGAYYALFHVLVHDASRHSERA